MSGTISFSGNQPIQEPRKFILQSPTASLTGLQDVFESGALGQVEANLPVIRGVAVQVAPGGEQRMRDEAARLGLKVYEDRKISIPDGEVMGPTVDLSTTSHLDNATRTIDARPLWAQGITGKGVNVAVIDTGIAPHKDLEGHIVAFHDVVNGKDDQPYDDHGHGTHVASTVAGTGAASHGWLKGVAPDAGVVGIKVLDAGGSGEFSGVIAGINWAVANKDKYNIRVLNLSLGAFVDASYKDDPVVQAIEAAEAAGILPVIAAGNSGPGAQTVGTPGNAPHALTVAALDDRGTPWRWDDRMAFFSSRGPTPIDKLEKPDVAAPGVAIMAARANTDGYTSMSGTSMATPVTAGSAALLFAAHPEATPAQVKAALVDSAHHMWGYGHGTQGAGSIDVQAALTSLESQLAARPDSTPQA